jgi:hypothetical protein
MRLNERKAVILIDGRVSKKIDAPAALLLK